MDACVSTPALRSSPERIPAASSARETFHRQVIADVVQRAHIGVVEFLRVRCVERGGMNPG